MFLNNFFKNGSDLPVSIIIIDQKVAEVFLFYAATLYLKTRTKSSRKQNLKIFNFEFFLSFISAPGQPPFLTTQNPKKLFLIYQNIFRILSQASLKTISYMLEHFLNFVSGYLKNCFLYVKIVFEILKFVLRNSQFPNCFIEF